METVITLTLVGCVVLFFEVVFPSGILGTLSLILLFASVYLGFAEWGLFGGLLNFAITGVLAAITVYLELHYMPNTKLGKKFMLKESINAQSNPENALAALVGKEGVTTTPLNPSGKVAIEGQSYEAQTMDGHPMASGVAVKVHGLSSHAIKVSAI